MGIKNKIISDLKQAMKEGNAMKRDTLRMLDAMIKNWEIEKKKKEDGLTDSEILEVIARAVKQRRDAAQQYAEGGRPELSEKEKKEMEILMGYMPKQMEEGEARKIVKEIIAETGAISKSEIGKVMGAAMGKLKGKIDGQLVKKIVEEELA
ncbi:MAG TPA: GatB/YqeY domain-containing protein [Candidatus Moranbacteria bacterium]|nr:GatB/YqeY domain-containing protein [Candidatus Moranbacteria bacterium]